jgi:hypothetical protein
MSINNITGSDYLIKQSKNKTKIKTMKYISKHLLFFAVAFSYIDSYAVKRTMIAMQSSAVNNCEHLGLQNILNASQCSTVVSLANQAANTFTSYKQTLLSMGRYQRLVNLTGTTCKRANLLDELIKQSNEGYTVDLYMFGHGGIDMIQLVGESLTGGSNGNLRSMLTEARSREGASFNFKLRLVYMGQCFASTLNDDWIAIGAEVSLGAGHLDYMTEPMSYSFVYNFVENHKTVAEARDIAFNDAKAFWTVASRASSLIAQGIGYESINDPKCDFWGNNTTQKSACKALTRIDQSKLVIAGNSKMIFYNEYQMSLNQTKTFEIQAKNIYNFAFFACIGEKYSITASSSDTWQNCTGCLIQPPACNANGYAPGPLDAGRRQPAYNQFAMVGETYEKLNDGLSYSNTHFSTGLSKIYSPVKNDYIGFFANDVLSGYGDNSGSITLTVTRIQ